MRRIHRLIAFLLAALWLPAVVHCGVETALELVEASGCCSHENDSGEASAGACTADPCAVFDEGHFRTDGEATGIEAPLAAAWMVSAATSILGCEPDGRAESLVGSPPDPGRYWVFERRAAPWANAPGLIAS